MKQKLFWINCVVQAWLKSLTRQINHFHEQAIFTNKTIEGTMKNELNEKLVLDTNKIYITIKQKASCF